MGVGDQRARGEEPNCSPIAPTSSDGRLAAEVEDDADC